MTKVFKKYSKKDRFILLAFGLFLITYTIYEPCCILKFNDTAKTIFKFIIVSFMLLFVVDYAIDFFTKKRTITLLTIIVSIIVLVTYLITTNISIFIVTVLIIELGKFEFKDLLTIAYNCILFTYIMIILASIMGFIPNLLYERPDGESRFSLGFIYPIVTSSYFLFILLMKYYLKDFKMDIKELLLDLGFACLLFKLTDARAAFIVTLFVIFCVMIIKIPFIKKINLDKVFKHKWVKLLVFLIPVLFFSLWLLMIHFYSQGVELFVNIDKLLSYRLYYSLKAFQDYNFLIWGSNVKMNGLAGLGSYIEWSNIEYFYLDNAFTQYLFVFGIIPLILIFAMYGYMLWKSADKKDYGLLFVIVVILIDGMIDPYLIEAYINLFVLFVGSLFFKNPKVKDIKTQNLKLEKTMNKKITAVVVTYNRKELLREGIIALQNQDYKDLNILIVDNASTDNTEDFIKDLLNEKTEYVNTGANLGGAGGFNFGMRKAIENGADYVWIMDDDCIVGHDSLTQLISAKDQLNDDFGFLSSQVLWTDNTPCKMNIQRISLTEEIKDFNKNLQPLKLASFVSLFIKAEAIENLGLPYKEFFIWGDDWEYTCRISREYKSYYVADSVVTHKCKVNMGSNIVKDSPDRLNRYFYLYRNEKFLYKKEGLFGRVYFACKYLYHITKVILFKNKGKKQKLKIMHQGVKASNKFNPKIEYAFRPDTKIKVLEFFGEPLAYGGQEAFIINMYKHFEGERIEYTFATPFGLTNEKLIEMANNRHEKILHFDYNFNSCFRKKYIKKSLKKIFKDQTFDVVHIHTGSIYTILTASKIAKKKGKTKIVISHSHATGYKNFKWKMIKTVSDRQIDNCTDKYLACSQIAGEFKFPKKIMQDGKCIIIKNGIEIDKYKFNNTIRTNYRKEFSLGKSFTLCNVGRFSESKNQEFVIKLVELLLNKDMDVKCVFVGSGDTKESIKQKIKNLNIADKFIFLENRNDVANLLMMSDVFVFPSKFEGLGIVAIESQATGLPTICSEQIPLETKLTDLISYHSLSNIEEWVDQIEKQKQNKIERQIYADKVAESGYSAKQSAKILEEIYQGKDVILNGKNK